MRNVFVLFTTESDLELIRLVSIRFIYRTMLVERTSIVTFQLGIEKYNTV